MQNVSLDIYFQISYKYIRMFVCVCVDINKSKSSQLHEISIRKVICFNLRGEKCNCVIKDLIYYFVYCGVSDYKTCENNNCHTILD